MTPLRQEIDHSKSFSSLSTSTHTTHSKEIDHSAYPPAIVSSESVDRQVRGPYSGTDHHPAIVSSASVDRQVRGDPYSSETSEELLNKPTKIPKPNKIRITNRYRDDIPEWLQEFGENLVDERVPEHRLTREFFS